MSINLATLVKTTALGAAAMYMYDPVLGRRRRALLRDKCVRIRKAVQETARVTLRDVKNRALGTVAEGRAALFVDRVKVDDAVLRQRVRSILGFVVRNPSSVNVEASGCRVTLTGPVLTDEVQQLINGVRSVRGVYDVENRLEVHEKGDNVPGLQGDIPKPKGQVLDVFQDRWSPTTRFLVGAAGFILIFGLNPFRKTTANLSLLVGLGLLACSVTAEEIGESTDCSNRH
jgi:BON domain-containing protein